MADNAAFELQEPFAAVNGAKYYNGKPSSMPPERKSELLYSLEEVPPWYTCMFLGLQNYLMMVGGTIAIPILLSPLMCIEEEDPARGALVSTIIFVSGIVTCIQTTFGVRLPIVQGGSASFLVPTIAILTTSFDKCADVPMHNMTYEEKQEVWQERMREIQGAIIVSSIFQIIVGFTGVIGLLLTYITPLTIVPTVTMVGLSLFRVAANHSASNWWISMLTMFLLIVFSQYLRDVKIPFPSYQKSTGVIKSYCEFFKLFPVMMAILISWVLCAILTTSGVLAEGSRARTDLTKNLLADSPWFRIPYPGQWGLPTVSVAAAFGMMIGAVASIIESIGDYYACARLSGAPPPPVHAMNRGIGIEGVGCVIAGLWGTGNGTTSYSENIGAIGVTKVASRRVIQYGGLIMIVFGVFSKFGALFVTIPQPVYGGVFMVMFAMIAAVGLSSLQFVDLNSSRNLFVLGFPIFCGLAIPTWLADNPSAVQTGSSVADQVIRVLLQTPMFLGGLLGFFLDNTVPGTDEERGLTKWNLELETVEENPELAEHSPYDLPFGMTVIRRMSWTKFIPFSPTFKGFRRAKNT